VIRRAGSRSRSIGLGLGVAWAGALVSFALAVVNPYFLNMFWQIPDGLEILHGHFPATVSYAIASGPLVSQEWLYEAAMAWFVQHGWYGAFVIVCALAAAATPLLVYATARAYGIADLTSGIAAFLVVGSRLAASSVRPETFAVDAFALELLVLASPRRIWWIVPIVLLWANVHASVVLAPFVALLAAGAGAFARRGIDADVRRALAVAGLASVATLVTPYGLRLWSYAFGLAFGPNPARAHLDVWRPLSFDVAGSVTAVLPGLLILLCCGVVAKRRYAAEIAIAALCFALTLTHARYAMFLVVAWAPLIARSLECRTPLGVVAARRQAAPAFALAPLAIYALVAALPVLHAPAEQRGPWQAAAAIAAEHQLQGNAYAPYVWAAYLHERGLPLRLLIDAHGDPYPRDVWDDHLALQDLHPNWREVLKRRQIGVVILPVDAPLAQALGSEPTWRRIGERSGIVAFGRRGAEVTVKSTSATRSSY
jgi:hypothetical protein